VPAEKLAGSRFVNLVMLGALAAELGEPPLAELVDAASEMLGKKVAEDEIRAALAAGFEEVACPV